MIFVHLNISILASAKAAIDVRKRIHSAFMLSDRTLLGAFIEDSRSMLKLINRSQVIYNNCLEMLSHSLGGFLRYLGLIDAGEPLIRMASYVRGSLPEAALMDREHENLDKDQIIGQTYEFLDKERFKALCGRRLST